MRDAETVPVPSLDRLDADGLAALHDASMEIVEDIGVQLGHERAQQLVSAHGGTVDADGVATIPRDVVTDCLERAPSSFTLHARNPEKSLTVGGDGPAVRAPGYGPPNVRTLADGRRPSRLSDYEDLLKLAQVEDVVTCTGYQLCEPTDVAEADRHYEMFRRALTLTDQPVMGATYGEQRARTSLEMAGIAMDDPDLREPYVVGLVNTVPPRRIGEAMLGGLLTYASHGQPVVVSSFTMAGASGPATLAASLAQANAENLVGITLAQLVNPGTPVVYGVPSSNVDTRYGSLSIGSPESALFVAVAAQLARFYDVPSRGGGGLTDAKAIDYHSGFESMFLQTVTDFSGIDFVLHAVGVLESYSAVSPEKFVLDCEALRYLDRFRDGFSLDADAFALDAIASTDPGGHFVSASNAVDEPAFFRSEFVDKRSHVDWANAGGKSAFEQGRDRVRSRLDAYERPPMPADVERELDRYVETRTANTE